MTPNTDAPDTNYDAADDYAAYPKLIQISFRNFNCNHKITPNTQKSYKKNTTPTLMPLMLMPLMLMTVMLIILTHCEITKARKRI